MRLQHEFPDEFARIEAGVLAPLERVLAAGRADGTFPSTEPARDAWSIHAVTWALVEARLAGDGTDRRYGARTRVALLPSRARSPR